MDEHTESPRDEHAHPQQHESGFARLERQGAEAMAERVAHHEVDEAGRISVDPGQEHRAPEERSTIHQALLDPEALAEDPDQRGAPR